MRDPGGMAMLVLWAKCFACWNFLLVDKVYISIYVCV